MSRYGDEICGQTRFSPVGSQKKLGSREDTACFSTYGTIEGETSYFYIKAVGTKNMYFNGYENMYFACITQRYISTMLIFTLLNASL